MPTHGKNETCMKLIANLKDKMTEMKESQPLTKAIRNVGFVFNIKCLALIKINGKLKINRFKISRYAQPNRYNLSIDEHTIKSCNLNLLRPNRFCIILTISDLNITSFIKLNLLGLFEQTHLFIFLNKLFLFL